jgi:hypothetical protein
MDLGRVAGYGIVGACAACEAGVLCGIGNICAVKYLVGVVLCEFCAVAEILE